MDSVELLHSDPDRLRRYAAGALDAAEDRTISEHVVGCDTCRSRLLEMRAGNASPTAEAVATVQLASAVLGRPDRSSPLASAVHHLEPGEIDGYLSGALAADDRARLQRHLDACARCREDIREVQRFDNLVAADLAELNARLGPARAPSRQPQRTWWTGSASGLAGAVAAAGLVWAVGVQPLQEQLRVAQQQQRRPHPQPSPAVHVAGPGQQQSRPSSADVARLQRTLQAEQQKAGAAETSLATLRQRDTAAIGELRSQLGAAQEREASTAAAAAGTVTLPASADASAFIARGMANGSSAVATEAARLAATGSGGANLLRGDDLTLLSPAGTGVLSSSPPFVLKAVPTVDAIQVDVHRDTADGPVAASQRIDAGAASDPNHIIWAPDKPLPRSHRYIWIATPYAPGGQPIPGGAVSGSFRIVDQATADRYVAFGLRLALAQVHDGLLDDADRTLSDVIAAEPGSAAAEKARRLEAAVQAGRQAPSPVPSPAAGEGN